MSSFQCLLYLVSFKPSLASGEGGINSSVLVFSICTLRPAFHHPSLPRKLFQLDQLPIGVGPMGGIGRRMKGRRRERSHPLIWGHGSGSKYILQPKTPVKVPTLSGPWGTTSSFCPFSRCGNGFSLAPLFLFTHCK